MNNAGIQFRTPLEEFPDDKWQLLLQTNVTGVFNVGKAVARRMIPRGKGKIINIASVQSELARPDIAPYTATKGAVKNLTRGMCADWAKHGLQINAIAPGYFRTEINQALVDDPEFSAWLAKRTPAGRWGEVEELIGAAVFLASDASSFVNGHVLYVDGGMTARSVARPTGEVCVRSSEKAARAPPEHASSVAFSDSRSPHKERETDVGAIRFRELSLSLKIRRRRRSRLITPPSLDVDPNWTAVSPLQAKGGQSPAGGYYP